ncbi:hypothetical protein GCM10009801_02080 [Streptomyces albiaxialis]|uniref:Integral membrane protein n=1 Tax=Streptomyces albiaxialis TaxID=329523 RepID=A0ABN2VEH1_9ACTN
MSVPTTTAPRTAAGSARKDLLRTSLRIDSWSTAFFGVFLLAGAAWLEGPLGLPPHWSVPFGVAMLGGAAALALIAGYPVVPDRLARAVVVLNAVSAVAMVVLVFTGVLPVNGLGTVFLVMGAVAVTVFAELEYVGLRRQRNGA